MNDLKKIAVIGAGVMGAGIAIAIANSDTEILLFDIVPNGAKDRNILARNAVDKTANMLVHPDKIKFITFCNLEDNLKDLIDVDWVIEAIIEKSTIKQKLYQQISSYLNDDCIISSNTSTILLSQLISGVDDKFKKQFLITHFFNPPRYMRLLEIITNYDTDLTYLNKIVKFCDIKLGKFVIKCNDRPGFIANRIGCFYLQLSLKEALELKISPSLADKAIAKYLSTPKTGAFGLMDLIGIDVMTLISSSLIENLHPSDYFINIYQNHQIINQMIEKKLLGRKSKMGFYRMLNIGDKKIKQVINFNNLEYEDEISSDLTKLSFENLSDLIKSDNDIIAEFIKRILWKLLYYSSSLIPEISDDIKDIDEAMKLGFNWQYGPFELLNQIGNEFVIQNIKKNHLEIPKLLETNIVQSIKIKRDYLLLDDLKHKTHPIFINEIVKIWDLGDLVGCIELNKKMNILSLDAFKTLASSLEIAYQNFKALIIIGNDNFSAGADLKYIKYLIEKNDFTAIDNFITSSQEIMKSIKYAKIPIIAAVSGFALGGGCELLLHCHKIRAYIESYIGLVEPTVGLIPAFGGCKELIYNYANNPNMNIDIFQNIMRGEISKSAALAKDMLLLGDRFSITMNKDRLLDDSKQIALESMLNYQPPAKINYSQIEFDINLNIYSDHDLIVAKHLKKIFNHPIEEDELFYLEKQYFIELCKMPETIVKIKNKL